MIQTIHLQDLQAQELAIYSRLNEAQLLHYYEPELGLFLAESPNVIERAMNAGYEPESFLVEEKRLTGQTLELIQRFPAVPVYTAPAAVLSQITGFGMTRGMLCAMNRKPLPSCADICNKASRIALLENVVNPTNVGAIFRSAAALGMDAVLLTPGCSDPLYRRAARVSMGTVFQIPWTYIGANQEDWLNHGLTWLKEYGFQTAAMALSDDSISIDDPALLTAKKLAIILGTEGDGLAASTIASCDHTVCIPMSHGVDSLNVAAASAVAFWQLGKRS